MAALSAVPSPPWTSTADLLSAPAPRGPPTQEEVLRAENPKFPDLIPAHELVIQGVMVALIRKRK